MAVIDKLPSGKWRVRIRKKGFPALAKTFALRKDAEGWGRKIESEQERGLWRDLGDAETTTLNMALDRYEAEGARKHKGYEVEQSILSVLHDEPLAKHALSTVRSSNIEALRDRWLAEGYAVGTINRRLTILSATFKLATRKWGMTGLANPVDGLWLGGATERSRRVLDGEIDAIIAASRSPYLPSLIRLALETGMRRGEWSKATWMMIDLDRSVVHLSSSITKNAKPRDVPLSPAALDVLHGLAGKKEGRVFSVTPHAITTAFNRAVKRARGQHVSECATQGRDPDRTFLVDLNYHDLRHEATTRLAKIFQLHELMRIVGHGSPRMLMRYYNPTAEDFAATMREHEGKQRTG